MEAIAGPQRATVEMRGAEDEGTRPVRKTARPVCGGARFEYPGISAGLPEFAGFRPSACWRARNVAKDGSECAAQNVRGFPRREVEEIRGGKAKPPRKQ